MFVYVFQSFSFFARSSLALYPCLHSFFLFWSSTNVVIILLFYVLLNYALRRDVLRSLSLSQIFRSISVCYSLAFLITGRFSLALSSIHFTSYLGYVLVKEGGITHSIYLFFWHILLLFLRTQGAALARNSFIFVCFFLICCNNIIPHAFCYFVFFVYIIYLFVIVLSLSHFSYICMFFDIIIV